MHIQSYREDKCTFKTQMLYIYIFYLIDKGIHLYSDLKFFFQKIDNESISLYSSGKRFQIFRPR